MRGEFVGLLIGIPIGLLLGVVLAFVTFFCVAYQRKRSQIGISSSRTDATLPIRADDAGAGPKLSDSSEGTESPRSTPQNGMFWRPLRGLQKANVVSVSGLLKYSYKDLHKATSSFTALVGEGAYGPVYKAEMSNGDIVAVKVLAVNSKQGKKDFQTEVMLLGRLHHRNLVNLIGYCSEKNQHMLIYMFMSKGSLASHLYNINLKPLKWKLRLRIALDVARGLEYLHDGAVPPVVHRDIKSSNILLDHSMTASVADFGLSREDMDRKCADIRGTFGYLDPEYVSTSSFTKKSDVYSYGVLLFELVAGRTPLQGLMEHVELASVSGAEGKMGWEEIADPRLNGEFCVEELNELADLANRCVNLLAVNRPSVRDIVHALSGILKSRECKKKDKDQSSASGTDEVTINIEHRTAEG